MNTLGPYQLGYNETQERGVYTGDARELSKAIPDESVDLIFTDPVYDRIEDYAWLAETAARVLKPDGALLVWSNGKWHYENTTWLVNAGLTYRYQFGNIMVGGPQPMNGKIIAKTNRVIWLDKTGASKMVGYWADGLITSTDNSLPKARWGKSPRMIRDGLRAFTHPDAIIFDPFTGGGTVPAVCKQLGRQYLAFEIDPETAELARDRIRDTQPPLFTMPQSEQMSMEFNA